MSFLQHNNNWMLLFTMFVSGAMLLWPIVQRKSSGINEIGTLRATHLLNNNNPIMLDVREPREYAEVKVRDAMHIPLSQLKDRVDQLAKDKARPVIIVDAKGMRGRGAGALLKKGGFAEIYMLAGGLKAWRDAGLPVEKV
jgi:rhodanese-related sulfurtransferase